MAGGREGSAVAAAAAMITSKHIIGEFRKNSSEVVKVTLEMWRGHALVNIRVWYYNASHMEMRPSKKGLAISTDRLPDLLSVLGKAMDMASPTSRPAA